MFYARPFGREHFSTFARMKAAGADVVELLVPEPGELDLAGDPRAPPTRPVSSVVLAARVNLTPGSRQQRRRRPSRRASPISRAASKSQLRLGPRIVGGPLYGAPLVFAGRAPSPGHARRAPAPDRRRGLRARRRQRRGPQTQASSSVSNRSTASRPTSPTRRATRSRSSTASARRRLGVMLDTFHMNMEEFDLPGAIRGHGQAARAFPGQREQPRLRRFRSYRLAGDRACASRRRLSRPDRAGAVPTRRRAGRRHACAMAGADARRGWRACAPALPISKARSRSPGGPHERASESAGSAAAPTPTRCCCRSSSVTTSRSRRCATRMRTGSRRTAGRYGVSPESTLRDWREVLQSG